MDNVMLVGVNIYLTDIQQ